MTTPVVLTVAAATPVDPASYPVGFTLRDDDGQALIVIADDPTEQHAHLEITNTSAGALLLAAPADGATASADLHHFELRFRPGALSTASLTQLAVDAQPQWSTTGPLPQADGTVSLFLLSTTARSLDAGAAFRFRLSRLTADGANGTRGTQLELRYRLHYPDGTPLADTKLLHLDLVNQLGKKYVPLHVGFVGSHTVLNDGLTPNALTVRLTNISAADLRLNGETEVPPTRFVVSFDAGETWGLSTPTALAAMTIDAIDGQNLDEADWDVQPGRQLGAGLAWTLTHKKVGGALGPGQVVQLRLGNIITAMPGGDTNLYLRYENVPGYWDGQFVCTIEKGPILFDPAGNVGIGTTTPVGRLTVHGDSAATTEARQVVVQGHTDTHDELAVGYHTTGQYGSVQAVTQGTSVRPLLLNPAGGAVGVSTRHPAGQLTVAGDSAGTTEARQIVVQGAGNAHNELAVGYHTTGQYGSVQAVTQGTSVRPLLLNPAGGGVGIGLTRPPTTALEVNGGIRSPMWQVITLFGNAPGPLPQTSETFTTGGGTLLLWASGSAYRFDAGLIGMELYIDGRYIGVHFMSINYGNQRTALTGTMVASGLPAGTAHTVTLRPFSDAAGMQTDGNDLFTVTVLELPF